MDSRRTAREAEGQMLGRPVTSMRVVVRRRWLVFAVTIVLVGASWFGLWRQRPTAAHVVAASRNASTADVGTSQPIDVPSSPGTVAGSVRDQGGEPIGKARVCAIDARASAAASEFSCADTGDNGRFAFAALRPGLYRLRASAVGFLPESFDSGSAISVRDGESRSDIVFVLEAGGANVVGVVMDAMGGPVPHAMLQVERKPDADEVVLTEADDGGRFAASISQGSIVVFVAAAGYTRGQVFAVAPSDNLKIVLVAGGTVNGIVVSHGDLQPIANVTVHARPARWGHAELWAVSRADGTFTLGGLEAGPYGLVGDGDHWRGKEPHFVQMGTAATIDHVTLEVLPALRMAGRVVLRSTGAPCPKGTVGLGVGDEDSQPVAQVASPIVADGRVELNSVLPGRYRVLVRCDGNVLSEGPRSLDLTGEDTPDLLWKVEPGLALGVTVVDAAGKPVPSATFQLEYPPTKSSQVTKVLVADANGRYDYPATLEPGIYRLAPAGGHKGSPVSLDLRMGMGKVETTLRLDGSGSILVDLRTPGGDPVDGMNVVAMPAEESPSADGGSSPANPSAQRKMVPGEVSVPTDLAFASRMQGGVASTALGAGRYSIGPLDAGRYELGINSEAGAPAPCQDAARFVKVSQGAVYLTLVLDLGGRIRGRVVDTGGNPVPDVWVSAVHDAASEPGTMSGGSAFTGGSGPGEHALSDGDGRFVIANLAPSDIFMVRAEQPGLLAVKRNVTPGSDVTLRLSALATLRGTATDSQGRPIPRFALSGASLDIEEPFSKTVVTQGTNWSVDGMPSGHVRLLAMGEDGRTAHEELDISEGQVVHGIRLVFQSAAGPM